MNSSSQATANGARWPRAVVALLGMWLVASAFLWRHSAAQKANGVVCGVLVVAIAVATLWWPRVRLHQTL